MAWTTITIEGGLFPSDLVERIATDDATGQSPADFGLGKGRRVSDEIQSAFSDARSRWDAFQRRLERSHASRTTLTRQDWVIPLLEVLGFHDVEPQRSAVVADGETFAISHRAGPDADAPPIHIAAIDQDLGRKADGQRRSPHAMVQDFLNRSEALWGLVTNGARLRLLRDSVRLSKPTYMEFDLAGMIEGNQYAEFAVLYRLLHATRFPRDGAGAHDCLLETYYTQGVEQGGRVRDKLRGGVEQAVQILGSGFLQHDDSAQLRRRLDGGGLSAPDYYRQLLRLIYRLLFLMVAEERSLLFPRDSASEVQRVYARYYGISALRARAARRFRGDRHVDLWLGLRRTFAIFREEDLAQRLELHALNGELFGPFACQDLETASITNEALLEAVRLLSTFDDGGLRRPINYAALDVEEFGAVYESLLDFHPEVRSDPWRFALVVGSERKQTGSYYTPSELVHELIESALVPVVEERLQAARTKEAKREALLSLRVCDPAAGSGHFLLAAARRIARELARVESGEEEPSPEAHRDALRQVIRHCIYAVDKNPLAVDLCKVALWIEGHNAGLPLSFLDHHVKQGDSLVGVYDFQVLRHGIPDSAYKALTGDSKDIAKAMRKRNKEEKAGQLRLDHVPPELRGQFGRAFAALSEAEERTPEDVHTRETDYEQLRAGGTTWRNTKLACDLWAYAFFAPLTAEEGVPTTADVRKAVSHPNAVHGLLTSAAMKRSAEQPFFHWPLEFPEVFEAGGFDVVLGNPPWERIKLQEQEFFGARDREIAEAPNKAARTKLIQHLATTNPTLYQEFRDAQHGAEAQSQFVHVGGRFPLGGRGDVNTYVLFAEMGRMLASERGRTGMIVQTGIATDHTTKHLFGDFVSAGSLVSLFDFENREGVFSGVHRSYKFSLLTLSGRRHEEPAEFAFFLLHAPDLTDAERRFTLTAHDFALMNPNTRTCPIFRTRRDAEITRGIYERVPVLIDESDEEHGNPWGISFLRMFDMSNDSGLFRDAPGPGFVRLYEDWMVHQFTHRFQSNGEGEATDTQLKDPDWIVSPRYWAPETELSSRISDASTWLLGFRNRTRATDARTFVCAAIPRVAVGNPVPLLMPQRIGGPPFCVLLAVLNSFVVDYVARQKVGGMNMNFFYVKQLPILTPDSLTSAPRWSGSPLSRWVTQRVVELTYTASDVRSFAQDCGYDGPPFRWDAERRFLLRCELDAGFFHLYGVGREDVDYMMDTFPIGRRKDEKAHGEYRTKRVILELYDQMADAMTNGTKYQTRLEPLPADPRVAHPARAEAQ